MGNIETKAIKDMINNPSHYTQGGIEVIDYIRAKLSEPEFIGYCLGNTLKYVSRAGHKGDALEDYKKAQVYLNWAIEILEKSENND